MNEAEMKAELERLRAENAKLKSKDSAGLSLKVSEKAPYPSTEWDVSPSPSTRNSGFAYLPAHLRSRRSSGKTTANSRPRNSDVHNTLLRRTQSAEGIMAGTSLLQDGSIER